MADKNINNSPGVNRGPENEPADLSLSSEGAVSPWCVTKREGGSFVQPLI